MFSIGGKVSSESGAAEVAPPRVRDGTVRSARRQARGRGSAHVDGGGQERGPTSLITSVMVV